jgi:hypothetical protein
MSSCRPRPTSSWWGRSPPYAALTRSWRVDRPRLTRQKMARQHGTASRWASQDREPKSSGLSARVASISAPADEFRARPEFHRRGPSDCHPEVLPSQLRGGDPPAACRRYTRRRCLIGPIIASYRPTTSRRSTSSVTASIPPPASAPGPTGRSEPAAARRVTISSPPDRCPPGPRRCWRQQPSHRIGHLPPSQPTHPTATRGFGSDAERCWEG